MFQCSICEKIFKSEPARRGHLSTHREAKRAKGRNKRFVQTKYDSHISRKLLHMHGRSMELGCRLPPSRRRPPKNIVLKASATPANENGYDGDSTLYSQPEPSNEQLEEILTKLRTWVTSSSSKFNEELLNWLRLPFKTPNKDMDNRFLLFLVNIINEHHVSRTIADEYLWMLETIRKGVYHLPSNFEEFDTDADIRELLMKPDLELLLVHMHITYANGQGHSYVAAIDFSETTITFIDTGDSLKSLTTADHHQMDKIKSIANLIKPAKYTIKIVTDAPSDEDDKFDCVFHTCLFAKCLARKENYHELKSPCRKEILYEFLKGKLV